MISTLLKDGKLGDPERPLEFFRRLRPHVTDTDALVLFAIKPDTEEGRKEGRAQAGRNLAALHGANGLALW